MNILTMIIPFILKLLNSWVDGQVTKGNLKKEAKEDFLKFTSHINSSNKMAEVRQDTKDQFAELTQQK